MGGTELLCMLPWRLATLPQQERARLSIVNAQLLGLELPLGGMESLAWCADETAVHEKQIPHAHRHLRFVSQEGCPVHWLCSAGQAQA